LPNTGAALFSAQPGVSCSAGNIAKINDADHMVK
jgi:hypothetical protein